MTLALGPAFDTLVSRFCTDVGAPLAVAVSGGSDSTALLHLMADWAARARRDLLVLTIDHGLRPEAAAEAAQIKRLANGLGFSHQTLVWTSPRLGQNAARKARHRLLARAARQAGASLLLLGHTLDDVIETIQIRRKRATSNTFLAGPTLAAPSPVWPEGRDCILLRPLILTRRETLRDALRAANRSWIEDPSNEDTAFERIEVRKSLAASVGGGDEAHVLEARDLLNTRSTNDQAFGDVLRDHVSVAPSGLIEVQLDKLSSPLQVRLVALIARVAGGHDRTPRAEPVRAMLSTLGKVGDRATLGGAWFQKTGSGVLVGRDPGELRSEIHCGLWDGRFAPDPAAKPVTETVPFLLRDSMPPDLHWRPVLAERLSLEQKIYQTPLFNPVQR